VVVPNVAVVVPVVRRDGSDVPVVAVRALPGFPDSALHHDPAVPVRWRRRSLPRAACPSPAIIRFLLNFSPYMSFLTNTGREVVVRLFGKLHSTWKWAEMR